MDEKIISFALYGNDPKYVVGVEKNILLAQYFLPAWTVYVLTSPNVTNQEHLSRIKDLGAEVVEITKGPDERNPNEYCMWWRYFPFYGNGRVIVRDADSRISWREVEYLSRWIDSDKDFFIIRDHPWHSPAPGGLIGKKNHGDEFREHFIRHIASGNTGWGKDQDMLDEFMKMQDPNQVFYCGFDRPETYIPRDDPEFFIGMQLDENDVCTNPVTVSFLKELKL